MTNEELWTLFPIILSEHKPQWRECSLSEITLLRKTVGMENIIRINHIGSTAVPNLLAKPTIDLLLEITDACILEHLIKAMIQAGYLYNYRPDNPAPHMMFMKGYTPRGFEGQAYHVHVRYGGDWDELYFRDYLLEHPGTAKQYGTLKRTLKEKYEHDRDAYTDAKTDFIKKMVKRARKAFGGRYQR